MTLCPIALAVGCQKCPVFRVCPLKSVIGDQPKAAKAEPAKDAKTAQPVTSTSNNKQRVNRPSQAVAKSTRKPVKKSSAGSTAKPAAKAKPKSPTATNGAPPKATRKKSTST